MEDFAWKTRERARKAGPSVARIAGSVWKKKLQSRRPGGPRDDSWIDYAWRVAFTLKFAVTP